MEVAKEILTTNSEIHCITDTSFLPINDN